MAQEKRCEQQISKTMKAIRASPHYAFQSVVNILYSIFSNESKIEINENEIVNENKIDKKEKNVNGEKNVANLVIDYLRICLIESMQRGFDMDLVANRCVPQYTPSSSKYIFKNWFDFLENIVEYSVGNVLCWDVSREVDFDNIQKRTKKNRLLLILDIQGGIVKSFLTYFQDDEHDQIWNWIAEHDQSDFLFTTLALSYPFRYD